MSNVWVHSEGKIPINIGNTVYEIVSAGHMKELLECTCAMLDDYTSPYTQMSEKRHKKFFNKFHKLVSQLPSNPEF